MKINTRNLGPLMAELRAIPGSKPLIIRDGQTELCGEAVLTETVDAAVLDFTPVAVKKPRKSPAKRRAKK